MVARNDVTGDALINTPKRGPREGQKRDFVLEMPVFEVMYCDSCFIKVSTSNGKCPKCEKVLSNG